MALNREQMIAALDEGGSVLHQGKLITRREDLPSAADLAQTSAERKAASGDLQSQINALQAQQRDIQEREKADAAAAKEAEAARAAEAEAARKQQEQQDKDKQK
ncbi:MAG: hypothetical protein ACR2LC_09665 [Pyrinomonadaceae bacterium]